MAASDSQVILVVIAVAGVIGQWGIGAFYAGRMDERVRGQGRDIVELKENVVANNQRLDDHSGRISHIEGRLGIKQEG